MIAVLFEVTPLPGQEARYFEIAAMLRALGGAAAFGQKFMIQIGL